MLVTSIFKTLRAGALKHFLMLLSVSVSLLACQTGVAAAGAVQKTKLTVAVASNSLAWLPYLVADGAGYLADEGLDVKNVAIGTNTAPIAALLGGSVDVAAVGVQAALTAAARKQPIRVLVPLSTEFTSMMFMRKEAMRKAHVSSNLPLAERVKALKGMKVAICNSGCSTDLLLRYLLATYAPDIKPDRDLQIVPILQASSVLASMSRGMIDVAMFSPPVPEKAVADGYADIYIDTIAGEVPATRGMLFTALLVTDQSLKKNPAALRALVRAIDRALKLIHTHPAKAGAAARKFMPKMGDALWNSAMQKMKQATPKDPFVSVDGLKKYGDLINSGATKFNIDYSALPVNDLVAQALKEER